MNDEEFNAAVRDAAKKAARAEFKRYMEEGSAADLAALMASKVANQEEENVKLRAALQLAREWGFAGRGYSARVASSLAAWVDGGMVGDPPKAPDYYPKCATKEGEL